MKIEIDLAKAREIKKESLRAERKPLLETQDILYMRAQESGSDTTSIVAEKVRLRDITKLCDTAESIEDLKVIDITKS